MPNEKVMSAVEPQKEENVVVEKSIDEIKAEAIAEARLAWEADNKKRLNEAEKGIRLKLEKEAEKAKMTAEELARSEYEEKIKALEEANSTYKQRELDAMRKEAVTSAKLPPYLANDVRLVNASPDDIPTIIKTIAKEHNEWLNQNKMPQSPTGVYMGTTTTLSTEELAKLAETNPNEYRRLRREQLYKNK